MVANSIPFTVSIPSNFDAELILPTGLKQLKKIRLRDGCYYLLSILLPRPWEHSKRQSLRENGFIYLKADAIKSVIGSEYQIVTDLLEQNGILLVNQQYIVGEKSKGYRITADYFRETIDVAIIDAGMRKRYLQKKVEREREQATRQRNILHLTKWLHKDYVTIDLDSAHNYIETYRILMLKKHAETQFETAEKEVEARYRIINRVFHQKHVAKSIDAGIFNCMRDLAGRFYSPIVNLKKELRGCICINGEKTGSIDIKSSQPYLFQMLLNKKFWRTGATTGITLYNTYKKRYHQLKQQQLREPIIMMLNNLEMHYGIDLQEMPLKKILWQEDFYTYLMNLVQASTTDSAVLSSFANRGKVKKTLMLLLYDLYHQKRPPYYLQFKQHFPKEVELMDLIKTCLVKGFFPTILQAVEAKLILEKCCSQIDSTFPRQPVLTVHDSIICKVGFIENAKHILESVLTEHVGIAPGLKVEIFNNELEMANIRHTVDKDWIKLSADLLAPRNSQAPGWVSSYNEEPKEIPLRFKMITYGGQIYLDGRMNDPDPEANYWEEEVDEEYANEYYKTLTEYPNQEQGGLL